MKACDLLDAELALDRLEAQLATELPGHMRAFARAYATGAPTPPAPVVSLGALELARGHPILADRSLALARLLIPLAIERDPRVAAARASTSGWPAYAALVQARDTVARERFGRPFLELVQYLHGVLLATQMPTGTYEPLPPWREPDGIVIEHAAIHDRWRALAAAHDVAIALDLLASTAKPRAVVVEPGREVILVVPVRLDTPYARFAVLHELGHALVAALAPPGTPRVVDEAVASWSARAMESTSDPWHSPYAAAARARRTVLAAALARLEGGDLRDAPPTLPPALLDDPGAQLTYVVAESLAESLPADGLASWLEGARHDIDRVTHARST